MSCMAEFLFRASHPYPVDVSGAEDSYIIDKSGKRHLDFIMGWCVGNAGWNKKTITKALSSFNGPTYAAPFYNYSRWEVLAEKIVSLLPSKTGACFRATGGTEAVELALKISRAFNKRKKFIAFRDAYHGQSLACLALVGLHEAKLGGYSSDYLRLDAGDWEKATDFAVKSIRMKTVSAFISEPIICNLGVIVPPQSFFAAVYDACKSTDTVFISDEVATGFGRTGKWFGFEHFAHTPDIITMAKGFSSGYAAIGATIASPAVAESMRFPFSNYSTFGWHPFATEAAIANIEYLQKEKLVEKSVKSSAYLMERLSEFCKPEGKGLCVGFETENRNIEMDCIKDGLLIDRVENRAILFPALDVKKEEMDTAVEIIKKHFKV